MKFPITFQHDSMQCGVACLQMICKYFGRDYSIDSLSKICSATTQGVSMLGLNGAATEIGFHALCAKVAVSDLIKGPMPCLLHWDQCHFVVLYKVKGSRKFYVADPGKGLVTYNQKEFAQHWTSTCSQGLDKGIVMFLEPTQKFFSYNMNGDNQNGERRSFGFLWGYVKKYRSYFLQVLLGLMVGCLIQLVLPFLTQSIVDVGIKHNDLKIVWLILLGQLVLTVSRTVIDFLRRWMLLHVNLRINVSMVSDFFIKLLKLPMSFLDTKLMGDLLQRMNDHQRVNTFLTQKVLNVSFAMLTFIVFSIVLLLYNKLIFTIFIVGSSLYGGWMALFLKSRKILDCELFEAQSENNNKTYEFITSIHEIKLQDCEQRRRWDWEDVQAELFKVELKMQKLQQIQEAGSIFVNEIKNIIITVIAAAAVIDGQMTLGMMLAVQYIIGQLNYPLEQLMQFFYSIQDVRISLERINEIHRKKIEDGKPGLKVALDEPQKGIEMNDLVFKYDEYAEEYTIDNVNVHIPKGKVTAIVGASGSGKTTLTKMMLGYYEPLRGKLKIGGVDIEAINKKWWRRQCGVVMQEGVVFSDTIARNIAADDNSIDKDRLLWAAKIACADGFIAKLPLHYNTLVGKGGVGLSQGQKQRILIARAVYRNPDYIFLDEATNALDANNERKIVENLDRFYQGKTVVVVAHRLSTVKNADQIIVLDHGSVVEVGNHKTLTAMRGVYYNLVKNQLELGN